MNQKYSFQFSAEAGPSCHLGSGADVGRYFCFTCSLALGRSITSTLPATMTDWGWVETVPLGRDVPLFHFEPACADRQPHHSGKTPHLVRRSRPLGHTAITTEPGVSFRGVLTEWSPHPFSVQCRRVHRSGEPRIRQMQTVFLSWRDLTCRSKTTR